MSSPCEGAAGVAESARAERTDHRDAIVVGLMALVASIVGVLNDFVYDDISIIRDNVRVHGVAHWEAILGSPYWPPPFVEQLYRPLTVLLLSVEYTLGGGSPLVFRLVSYVLYVASAVAVFSLFSSPSTRSPDSASEGEW